MKAYIYKPEECGLTEWPSGTLRLEGSIPVENPDEADVFIVPGCMAIFKDDLGRIDRLPYMAGRESRHVLFDVSDYFTTALKRQWIIIRCDARDWMLRDDPNTINFAWPVEDFAECIDVPEGGFRYDVSAHMWTSTQTRVDAAQSCLNHPGLKSDIALYPDFTGYIYYEPEGIRRRAEFRRSMKESRIALCPESIPGVFPYRFFEAMSAGRVPLLVGSDFVFPWADEIAYDEFILRLPRDEASKAAEKIAGVVGAIDDDELEDRGRLARDYWERFLDSRNWAKLMTAAVEKKLLQMGACLTA